MCVNELGPFSFKVVGLLVNELCVSYCLLRKRTILSKKIKSNQSKKHTHTQHPNGYNVLQLLGNKMHILLFHSTKLAVYNSLFDISNSFDLFFSFFFVFVLYFYFYSICMRPYSKYQFKCVTRSNRYQTAFWQALKIIYNLWQSTAKIKRSGNLFRTLMDTTYVNVLVLFVQIPFRFVRRPHRVCAHTVHIARLKCICMFV